VLDLQRRAGNAAVGRLMGAAARASVQRSIEQEGSPGRRPNLDTGDSGPGVSLLQWLLGAAQTGAFDQQTRRAVDRFQRQQGWDPSGVGPMTWAAVDDQAGSPGHRPNLVAGDRGPGVRLLQRLLGVQETGFFGPATRMAADAFQRAQGWKPSGIGPMTWAALDQKAAGPAGGAGTPDPMQVLVPGTWVDDFAEVVYDIDYRIDEGGSPSEWLQVYYHDGTKIDLNWHDFADVRLGATEMMEALRNRHPGPGGRIFPAKFPNAAGLGLSRQTCPRLWAAHEDADEIGAKSTMKLMLGSLDAVLFVLTVPAMPAGPPPESPSPLKANRRAVARGSGPGSGGSSTTAGAVSVMESPLAKVRAAEDFYPGHQGAVGTLEAPGRQPMRIKSGVDGGPWGGTQRGGIPRGQGEAFTSGGPSQGNIGTHVEGHTAAIMHQQGLSEATLTMGMDQCAICARNLPSALPPGAELKVVHIDATGQVDMTIYRSNHGR
jgi:peptidoglycan hydrolase-like protein with peptidoglycan-binding domain